MQINVKVIAGARKNLVKRMPEGMVVYLTAPAVDGKANKALIGALAEEFDVAKSRIEIIKGLKSRHKTIKINKSVI